MKYKAGDWIRITEHNLDVILEILTPSKDTFQNYYHIVYRYTLPRDGYMIGYVTDWPQSTVENNSRLLDEQSIKTFKMEQL